MSNSLKSNPFQEHQVGLNTNIAQALDMVKPLINIAKTSQNPQKTINELCAKNPQINSIIKMLNGKSPDAVLYSTLKSNGIDPNEIYKYLQQSV